MQEQYKQHQEQVVHLLKQPTFDWEVPDTYNELLQFQK